jgi:hypothetical protein
VRFLRGLLFCNAPAVFGEGELEAKLVIPVREPPGIQSEAEGAIGYLVLDWYGFDLSANLPVDWLTLTWQCATERNLERKMVTLGDPVPERGRDDAKEQ